MILPTTHLSAAVFPIISTKKLGYLQMIERGFSADASTTSMLFNMLVSKEQDPAFPSLRRKFLT